MEAATLLGDLAALPGNRFEALRGDRKSQYSIRINDGPSNVEIVDYH
jgi:proteic killer suppression protein